MVLLARVLPLAGALAPAQVLGRELVLAQEPVLGPVSYTHLTLPTID